MIEAFQPIKRNSWNQDEPFPTAIVNLTLIAFCRFLAVAEEPETTFKVDVKLVNVFVTVTDARGAPVANLQKEKILLKEDGKEQKIAIFDKESALPLSIVLAVDTSLSTRKDLPLELDFGAQVCTRMCGRRTDWPSTSSAKK
jgi:hypothetical protein